MTDAQKRKMTYFLKTTVTWRMNMYMKQVKTLHIRLNIDPLLRGNLSKIDWEKKTLKLRLWKMTTTIVSQTLSCTNSDANAPTGLEKHPAVKFLGVTNWISATIRQGNLNASLSIRLGAHSARNANEQQFVQQFWLR